MSDTLSLIQALEIVKQETNREVYEKIVESLNLLSSELKLAVQNERKVTLINLSIKIT
jgi:hypothetical protein